MCTSWHTDSDLALCPNVLYHQEIEKVICDSGGNSSAPLRMSSFLTVLRQQVLHWTWSFHSSWLFLRWSVAWQNHLHRRPFGSNHWLSVLSLSSLPLVRWHCYHRVHSDLWEKWTDSFSTLRMPFLKLSNSPLRWKPDTLNLIISLINQRKRYIFTTFRLFSHEILLSLWRHLK